MWTITEAPVKFAAMMIGVSVTLVGGTYKSVTFVDNHYAHQDDVELISMRLEEKITNDRVNQIQSRIWRLEEQYGLDRTKWPQSVLQEVKELEMKKQRLDKHLENIDEQMIKQGVSPMDAR